MPKIIKWGILGLGKIAHKFASDLALVKDAELYAVASRSLEKATEFKEQFLATEAYDSYKKLACDEQVDAIYIATPHAFHAQHSILCLQEQKAVLCEKPFAMNLQEVSKMIAVAQQNNTLLMEALWTAFLPHYQYVVALIRTKKFGELHHLKADFGFYTPYNTQSRVFQKKLGGGSLLDIGIYPIFAALTTLGIPEKIDAKATFFENGADASCDLTFTYKEAVATLKSTLLEETPTEAIFTFDDALIKIHSRFHEPSSVTIYHQEKEDTITFKTNGFGYYDEILHFNDLLRKGKKESDIMTFDLSKSLIVLLDGVRSKIGLSY